MILKLYLLSIWLNENCENLEYNPRVNTVKKLSYLQVLLLHLSQFIVSFAIGGDLDLFNGSICLVGMSLFFFDFLLEGLGSLEVTGISLAFLF